MFVKIKNQTVEYISDYTPTSTLWKRQAGPAFRIAEVGGVSCFIKRFQGLPPGAELLNALKAQFRPFTPQVYDFCETTEGKQTVYYLFTEALNGRTLEECLAANEPVALERLTGDLHTALAALHDNGFWMADFCEKNIFFSGGRYYLIDLDSAQPDTAAPSSAPNTPGYMPSQELAAQALFFYREVLHRPNFQLRDITGRALDWLRLALLMARLYFVAKENIPYRSFPQTLGTLPARLDAAAPYARALFIAAANGTVVPDGLRTLLRELNPIPTETLPTTAHAPKIDATKGTVIPPQDSPTPLRESPPAPTKTLPTTAPAPQIDAAWWATLDDTWRKIFIKKVKAQTEDPDFFQKIINLTKLNCRNNQFTSLEPLRGLVNLTTLNCSHNEITSLEPLRGLTKLTQLNCYANQFTSLEPLRGLTNLQELNCYNTGIESLEPLHGLTNLKKLNCSGCNITKEELYQLNRKNLNIEIKCNHEYFLPDNISVKAFHKIDINWWATLNGVWRSIFKKQENAKPNDANFFQKIADLTYLNCSNNQITSLEPVRGLINLTELDCWSNQIISLEPLCGLKNLTELDCERNQITSLEPLRELVNLTKLMCQNNQINSLEPLRGLTSLIYLWCQNNQITSLEPLRGLTNLTELNCWSNQITSLEPLRELVNLTELDCERNQITSLEPLRELINLTKLMCQNNQINSLEPLKVLKNLMYLGCHNNQINSLEPLKGLTNLIYLWCQDNQINSLEPLRGLTKLTQLNCSSNQITLLELLRELKNLTELDCSSNRITSLEPLRELKKLTQLDCSSNQITSLEPLRELKKLTQLICWNNQIPDDKIKWLEMALPGIDIFFW